MMLLPQNIPGLIAAIIFAPLVYGLSILLVGGVEKRDVRLLRRLGARMGPLSGTVTWMADLMDRWAR